MCISWLITEAIYPLYIITSFITNYNKLNKFQANVLKSIKDIKKKIIN